MLVRVSHRAETEEHNPSSHISPKDPLSPETILENFPLSGQHRSAVCSPPSQPTGWAFPIFKFSKKI